MTGEQSYGAIEYRGTWFVTDSTATDYVGCVFGYQNNRKFYLVMWKSRHSNYDVTTTYRGGIKGIQIKVFYLRNRSAVAVSGSVILFV